MVGVEIGPSKEGSFIGGSVNNVINISRELFRKGHQLHLITSPARFSEGRSFNPHWIEVRQLKIHGKYPSFNYGMEFILKSIQTIKRFQRKNLIDIVHGHSGFPVIGLVPSLSRRILSIPSIHSLYCPLEEKGRDKILFQLTQSPYITKNVHLSVDRILALTKNIKNSLKKIGIQDKKITVIPPAIDTDRFSKSVSGIQIRESLGIEAGKRIILFVGNLTKTKGIDLLVNAFKKVQEVIPSAHLLIALHMPNYKLEEETASLKQKLDILNLSKQVTFMGITTRMAQVYAACDVFVAPFRNTYGPSDYPLPVMEAMASGKPVIASSVGGLTELITHNNNGILVNPGSVSELIKAIVNVLEDEKRARKIADNASIYVKNNFSIENIVEKIESIYERFTNCD